MTSPSTKRLLKESTDLHKNPSPYFTAAPITDSNLHDWHFTLTGPPPPTPYAGGLYHGRITFPPTYPLRPPSFRFLTPSGRFEVNREICLSISGHHEETWQPAWGVRTALLAIRSEIFGGESKGQVGGMEGSEETRREFARESVQWTCRECGVSNGAIMEEWWGVCAERGVEVDVEGFKKKEAEEKVSMETSEATKTETAEPSQPQPQSQSQPEPQSTQPEPVSNAPSASPAVNTTPAAPSTPAPAPAPASQPQSSALQPRAAAARPVTVASPDEPANSPWVDRAIVAVVLALILMILRRTLDKDDL